MHHAQQHKRFGIIFGLAALVVSPAFAAAPDGWLEAEVGATPTAGSTTVVDGVWTVKGSGTDIASTEEDFHFVYQSVKGDGSITARLPKAPTGGSPNQGVMIRASTDPDAARAALVVTTAVLSWKTRTEAGGDTVRQDLGNRRFPTLMRVQRTGSDFAGFTSTDGKLWTQVTPLTRIAMEESALYGLAVTSRADTLTTATFDQVAVAGGAVSPTGVIGSGGDKAVLLSWNPIVSAEGYNIYRGAANATADQLVKLNSEPTKNSTFTDNSADLVNGTAMLYAVVPVVKAADGSLVEGVATSLRATPVPAPAGFAGTSMNEGTRNGTVAFDAATGEITIKGSGGDLWGTADGGYFVSQPVEGDFMITVTALTKPSNTDAWAKAGLMIRDSLAPGARDAYLVTTVGNGLSFQWRPETGTDATWGGAAAIENADLKVPIVLRLTRKGNTITPEHSTDGGKTFVSSGDAYEFTEDLPKMVHAGLAITAHNAARTSEAKFRDLTIQKL